MGYAGADTGSAVKRCVTVMGGGAVVVSWRSAVEVYGRNVPKEVVPLGLACRALQSLLTKHGVAVSQQWRV